MKYSETKLAAWIDKYVKEDVEPRRGGRWAPRMYRIWVMAVPAVLLALLIGWTFFVLLGNVSGFNLSWWPWRNGGKVPPDERGDLVRDTLGGVALFGALLAGVYAYRKQRMEEAGGHRADAQDLSKRYQDAAEQLGHEKAAVRLAGVYAMARLADEWPEQRETCVDVLCAYLREPASGDSDSGAADMGVRHSILQVIADHVDVETKFPSWSGMKFSFRGAHLENWRCRNARFDQLVIFDRTTLNGDIVFAHADFAGGISFEDAEFFGNVFMDDVKLGPVMHSFAGIDIQPGGELVLNPIYLHPDGTIDIAAKIRGECRIDFKVLEEPQGFVSLRGVVVANGAQLTIDGAGEQVGEVHIKDGSNVLFESGAVSTLPEVFVRLPYIHPRPGFEIAAGKHYEPKSDSANGGRSPTDHFARDYEQIHRAYVDESWTTE